jgi:hypothetical protein
MKKKLLLLFIYFFIAHSINAAISLVSDAAQKSHVPVDQKVAIYYIQVQTTADDLTLSSFTVSASGEFSFDADAYKSVEIYQDGPATQIGGDGIFSLIDDTMINSLAATPLNTTVSVNIAVNSSQTIASTNATTGYGYWVVVELDSTKLNLGESSTFVVNTIFASDSSKLENVGQATITATGLNTTFYTNLAPDFVFPGQEEVSFLYFTTESLGEDADSLALSVSDSYNHFVDSNDEDGVDQAELFVSVLTDETQLEVRTTFNNGTSLATLLETLTYESTDWDASASRLIFQDQFPSLIDDEKKGFWVVYDIGDNISVTSSTQINLTVDSFSGVGESSALTIESATTNISISVPVAGVVVEDAQNLVSDDIFGPSTFSPMMSFKLRSYQAPTIVNKLNIVNNGSVQFWTKEKTEKFGENVVVVELYQDTDQNESFSLTDDTLVGELICNNDSTNTLTKAPVTTNVSVSAYDSSRDYPLNNEVMLFVVYRFGSSIDDTNDVSGNYSTSEIGNIFVTGNYTVSGVVHSVLFKGSNSSDVSTVSSSPTSNIAFSDTNIALSDIQDIAPTTVYEGQEKVPMLYVEINAETNVQTASFEIKNSLGNFYGNSTGITRVWVYRDVNANKVFDDSDTFVTSTSSFSNNSTQLVSVSNIEMILGVNRFLLLYDMGSNMEGQDAAAQLNSVSVTGGSATIGGVFPSPDSPALVSGVQAKPLSSFTLDNATITDASVTFNLTLTLQNNSGKTIDVLEYYPKFYLNDIAGLDISYEFTVVSTNSTSFSLLDGASTSVGFQVRHSNAFSQGSAIVDGYIRYTGNGDADSILLQRYLDGNDLWKSAVSQVLIFPIETTVFISDVLPAYINEPLQISRSNSNLTFLSGSAVDPGDVMVVNFEDASGIDQGTISVLRGTDILYQSPSLDSLQKYFTFDKSADQLTFYVGDQSESVILNMNDLFGNSLPTATFRYTVSSVVDLENSLFYPNPYVLGGNNLKLGFSISQPSDISFYIYDFTGNEVFKKSQYFSEIGYNYLEISESESFVAPGVFICRILATDNDGNESVKTAKLAIY